MPHLRFNNVTQVGIKPVKVVILKHFTVKPQFKLVKI